MPHHDRTPSSSSPLHKMLDPLRPMWDLFPMGVMVTDLQGNVVYYNQAYSMIDELPVDFVLGKNVRFLYGPDPGPSLVISCLESQKPIINYVCVYRTVKGKIINSAHWIYPFLRGKVLLGCMAFVQELDALTEAPEVSCLRDLPDGLGTGGEGSFTNLVSKNAAMLKAIYTAKLGARNLSPVLLYGETGTGKEVFARNIHGSSMHRAHPFVAVNCAAIPENLLESLLFGTTRGAFTGAMDKPGLFEQANGGTLFLDETDAMPLALQPKLLRVLQDRVIRRMGSGREIRLEVKIISAMSQDPQAAIASGKLRPDLFYRLGVIVIGIPPLRQRPEDIEDLSTYFILKYDTLLGKKVKQVSPELLHLFCGYQWPGNVRELEHIIEATMGGIHDQEILKPEMVPDYFYHRIKADSSPCRGPVPGTMDETACLSSHMPFSPDKNACRSPGMLSSFSGGSGKALASGEEEREAIISTLTTTFGNVTMAARILGVSRQNLSYKLKKHGLHRKDFRQTSG